MGMTAPQFETHLIDSKTLLEQLKYYVSSQAFDNVVLDVETNSASEKQALLYGIGLSFVDNEAFYIPWRNKDGELVWSEEELLDLKKWLYDLFSSLKLIGHNVVFDALVIKNNLNIDIVENIYSDTILQRHTLKEEGPFGLKVVAVEILGEWADKAQKDLIENIKANGGKTTKENFEMFKADTKILAEYCCWDVILTRKLFVLFEEQLKQEDLMDLFYKEEVMPLYKICTIPMKEKGFPVDVDYFKSLKKDIETEINNLEDSIQVLIEHDVESFVSRVLNDIVPIKPAGNFPKYLAKVLEAPLPINQKTGEITLAKKGIELQKKEAPEFSELYDFILKLTDKPKIPYDLLVQAQKSAFFESRPEQRYVFNLKSNDHLAHLFVEQFEVQPEERTETGKPKIDDSFFESILTKPKVAGSRLEKIAKQLVDFKKLNKLSSTYVDGILEREIDGVIYSSLLQFGTTSGRYSSRDPNLQNIPRVKDEESNLSPLVLKFTNAIKKGFISGSGYKLVNADYSSLEPVCFAHVSNEEKLRNVFKNNDDLYSSVAINVFKIKNASANKKDTNYLKNTNPEKRQQAKIFCLAVVYGAEAARIGELMGMEFDEANKIINEYLTAYPMLKKYMVQCDIEAKAKGKVKTDFGRIRHLDKAREFYKSYDNNLLDYNWAKRRNLSKERREFKNALNNSKNFKIQGLAAHIVNRAMIQTQKRFNAEGIDGYICMQVHDEITCIVKEQHATKAAEILKDCMENTTIISVPLKAEPLIADNWAEAK